MIALLALVLFLVLRRRTSKDFAFDPRAGVVDGRNAASAFVNPLYDTSPARIQDLESEPAGYFDVTAGEDGYANMADEDQASGYSDLSPNNEFSGYTDVAGAGYMDLEGNEAGYMDVEHNDDAYVELGDDEEEDDFADGTSTL